MQRTPLTDHPRGASSGFSLTELLLAMGLFSLVSVGLVALLSRATDFLTAGQSGAETMDAIQTFSEAFAADVETVYTASDSETGRPAVRMYSDHVECDVGGDEKKDGRIQRLFFTRLIPREATSPITRQAGTVIGAEAVMDQIDDLNESDEGRLRATGGLMEVFWTAIPEDAADPAVMTLFRGFRSPIGGPDSLFPNGTVLDPGSANIDVGPTDAADVRAVCRPLMTGVLHFGVQFWSRKTETWDQSIEAHNGGALDTWDSTRGILPQLRRGGRYDGFLLGRGFESLDDPNDDTFPRRMRVTVVVEQVDNSTQNMYLSESVSQDGNYIVVNDARRVPAGDTDKRFVKIGSEWIEFEGLDGNTLTGCSRGVRGTLAAPHDSGDVVHYGRTVVREYTLATFRDTYQDDIGGRR